MGACPMCKYNSDAVVADRWEFSTDSYCPTQNTLKGNTKFGYDYRKWRRHWEVVFGDQFRSIPRSILLRRVTVTRLYGKGKRTFDNINFAGGCKPLIDTLVNMGALYDDNPTFLEDHYLQAKSPDGVDRVVVLIEELA
jgi:hypothetical protein